MEIEKMSYLFSGNRTLEISLFDMNAWQKHQALRKRERLSKQELRKQQLANYGKGSLRVLVFLQALANPVRLMIIKELQRRPLNVTELSTCLNIEQPSVSRHLRLLHDSGILLRNKHNNEAIYSISEELSSQLKQDLNWITRSRTA